MNAMLRAHVLAGLILLLLAPAALALDVTFDANATSLTIVDDGPGDLNTIDPGVIDFDLTGAPVGGVLSGAGRVSASSGPIGAGVHLGGPPAGQGTLQNIDASIQTVTVTVNYAPTAFGPPLGWSVVYDADFDDPTLGPVSSPSGGITLEINPSTVLTLLSVLPQAPVSMPTSYFDDLRASDAALSALESRLTYTVELGPDDRVVLADIADGSVISGYVYNQDYKCMDRMTKGSNKLAEIAVRADLRCVKDASYGGGDATACVDDPAELRTEYTEMKLLDQYVEYCETVPAWGVNGASCCENGTNEGSLCTDAAECPDGDCRPGACITHAGEYAASDIAHEIFGASVVVSATSGKYQTYLLKGAAKSLKERWKLYRTCKRNNATAISDDAALVSTCLGPPQPDPSLKVARADAKIGSVVDKLVNAGFSPVGAQFGGACTAVSDALFADCVAERIQCAFCKGINVADDIAPPLDCDLFDDGTTNASCP